MLKKIHCTNCSYIISSCSRRNGCVQFFFAIRLLIIREQPCLFVRSIKIFFSKSFETFVHLVKSNRFVQARWNDLNRLVFNCSLLKNVLFFIPLNDPNRLYIVRYFSKQHLHFHEKFRLFSNRSLLFESMPISRGGWNVNILQYT